MDQWQQIDGVQRRTRTYVVRGRLHAAGVRSPELELLVTDFVHGGAPYRAEGTMPSAHWDRLTHPLSDRRLRLVARNGPSVFRSDDVVPCGSRAEGRGRVRFTLSFNHALEVTHLQRGSCDRARAHITFGDLPFCRLEVDHRRRVIASKLVNVRAANWHLRIAPRVEWPEPGPGVEGLVLPGRVEAGLRGAALAVAVAGPRARAVDALCELADDVSAVLSMLALQRSPWLSVSFAKPGRTSDPYVVVSRPSLVRERAGRTGLVFRDEAPRAIGAALRSVLRLRAKTPGEADVLRHVMLLFASAVEDRSVQRAWYAIAQSIDLLGSVASMRGEPSAAERRNMARELRDLDRIVRFANDEGLCAPIQVRLNQLRGAINGSSYFERIRAVVRHNGVRIDDLGGDDLLCDVRDIRNALMHRSSMGEAEVARLLRRGATRGLAFSTERLPTERVALQMMHDRHEPALALVARILLRVTGVPERCAPGVWMRAARGVRFG